MLWTVSEAARELRVSERTLYELAKRPGFPVLRVGRRLLFEPEAVKAWAREQGEAAKPVPQVPAEALPFFRRRRGRPPKARWPEIERTEVAR